MGHDDHDHPHEHPHPHAPVRHSERARVPAAPHSDATHPLHAFVSGLAHEAPQDSAQVRPLRPGAAHTHEAAALAGRIAEEHRARGPRYAQVFVITCSDTRTEATDEGGLWLRAAMAERGHVHSGSRIVRDEPALILHALDEAKEARAQVVLITGGTGLSSRDATFEAISQQIARPLPGFGELFRALSYAEIGSAAMLSRAIAGVRADGLLIFAMPGSPSAVRLACERLIFPELTHLLAELSR